jgi:cysteinyl-tRNA synthetase
MFKLYNTLTRRIEPFEPMTPGMVKMYSCGPTVYRYIHIGNLRTFLMADWLRRTLAFLGYEVRQVKNITDVGHMRVERLDEGEDKLIAQARREGKTSREIADFYTAAFHDDEARLGILPANTFPRATDHVAEMIELIKGLEENGLAYASGGNVYFAVGRFPRYGQLSGNQIDRMLEGIRDAALDANRRNPEDFALWKQAEPGREMAWDSPWGRGFPGWHIECSAMCIKHLGEQIDIHTGGVDNIFPHHEGELAQSEGYTGKRFVNYWVHAQHLLADGQKMAKSTGNAYTLADIEARGFEPMALRLLFAMVHYRSRLNFTFSSLRAAQTALERLRGHVRRIAGEADEQRTTNDERRIVQPREQQWRTRFVAALEDDLNMPKAIATIWDLLRERKMSAGEKLALLLEWDQVLGLGVDKEIRDRRLEIDTPATLQSPISNLQFLIAGREQLRQEQRYDKADTLRNRILALGYRVRDTRDGPVVVRRTPEEEFGSISRSNDVPDMTAAPDLYEFSINLLAHNSRADLERCIDSIVRHRAGHSLELVIVDNGSTDDTIAYLQNLVRSGVCDADGAPIPLRVLFADHNMGFAAGRNATMRASRGRHIVLLDTSIELRGDIWTPLARHLADEQVGLAGPYGLITDDLKEFCESIGPDVDAVEGYLMAFRRALAPEVGWFEEKFRFYRMLDVYESFVFKTSGYRVVVAPDVAALLERHPHAEWYSLTDEERATRSKKNFDLYWRRWHHGQSLQVANYSPAAHWFGHDHPSHLGPGHTHPPEELPPPGVPHSHKHQHWPDHAHEHLHYHSSR